MMTVSDDSLVLQSVDTCVFEVTERGTGCDMMVDLIPNRFWKSRKRSLIVLVLNAGETPSAREIALTSVFEFYLGNRLKSEGGKSFVVCVLFCCSGADGHLPS